MAKKVTTVCHDLKILPTRRLINFGEWAGGVIMEFFQDGLIIPATVPGSVFITTEVEEGIYTKSITFEIRDVTAETSEMLHSLKSQKILATYKDESRNSRVCGSPDYPLSLDFYDEGGVFIVNLTGKSNRHDGFLRE